MGSVLRVGRSGHGMSGLVCGLDVLKDSTYATILTSRGKIVDQTRMSNERVVSYLSHFSVGRVAMESSNLVAALYRRLEGKGYRLVLSHPKKTRHIAEAKIKGDRAHSRAIAELARLDALPLAYMPDKEVSILREQ